jgi:transposase-like protein
VSASLETYSPPFCPAPDCRFHVDPRGWRFKRKGFFRRLVRPYLVQRFLCLHCHRSFSSQTFSTTYWLKRPDLLHELFMRLVGCSGYRQIARALRVSPTTVLRQTIRLGRHCLLFHERLRPKGPLSEPLAFDGFETFEYSQYTPVHLHVALGSASHYFYGFTDSELRRKGRMTARQRARRAELERLYGRPDPKSIEREVRALLELLVPEKTSARLISDEHPAYVRALRRLRDRRVSHQTVSSRAARTPQNPLFAVNAADLLTRHSSANHKRETIAFSKRRQSAVERHWLLAVWKNYVKPFSEKRQDATPAQRLGVLSERLSVEEVLSERLFPSRIGLPARLQRYYDRDTPTRRIPNGDAHRLQYAY